MPDENYSELMHGWAVPSLASYAIVPAASTLGAVIMPHNLYLHSGLACEHEKVNLKSHRQVADAIRYDLGPPSVPPSIPPPIPPHILPLSRRPSSTHRLYRYNAIDTSLALVTSFFINLMVGMHGA